MSAWLEKYVIGLTGNIATGKSEVRQMLEKLGAFGIDADRLAHQVVAKGEPAYAKVIQSFGEHILDKDGQINRGKLAQIVFSDPAALACLESIVHPEVRRKVNSLVTHASESVIVIEAIKLIEAGYPELCDEIWVTYAPLQVQLNRLMQQRGLTEAIARQRISAQPAQEDKIAAADVVINNEVSLDDVRQQVENNWQRIQLDCLKKDN
jgi:dephospho-CoA kinase